MAEKSKPLSRKKYLLFVTLMIGIPVVFLAIVEILLRLIGYGDDYPLVRKEVKFNKKKYVVNRQVTQRYFSLPPHLLPEASEEVFDPEKKPGALRVFCLGGSTTAGFPFEINATFPFQLQYRLRNALLDNYVEVVNLGISAVNSYTVLDLLPEVLELEPDVLLIYMGHNEFYGALGVGSTQSVFRNRSLILLYLKLKKLRLVQLLESMIQSIFGLFSSSHQSSQQSLMQAMVGEQIIPEHSEEFQQACRNFEENLTDIVRRAKEKNVPVVLSTLVSNVKDQEPFVSRFSDRVDAFTQERLRAKLLKARRLQIQGEHSKALQILSRVAAVDSSSAELRFLRARSLLSLGHTKKALPEFKRARDLDMLRFRAPGIFNDIIKRVARENDVPLVDMEKIFQAASKDGIPGENLFYEHLHPNFDGYRLMAQAFYQALRTLQILNPPEPPGYSEDLFDSTGIQTVLEKFASDSAGVTPLDLEFGELRIFYLIHRWPFDDSPVDITFYRPVGSEITRDIAIKHLQKKVYWDGAHYNLAEYYEKQNRPDKALKEYQAVYIAFHENYYPAFKIGDLFFLRENFTYALRWYNRALKNDPQNPHILAKLGNVTVLTNRFQDAVKYLSQSLEIDSRQNVLTTPQKATALYLLSVSYANLQQFTKAMEVVNRVLALKPDFRQARELKAKLRKYLQ